MDEWTVKATENGYVLSTNLHECVCLVGKAGLIAANGKREGDMATPVGNWPLRRVYFRPDRMTRLKPCFHLSRSMKIWLVRRSGEPGL